MKNIFYLLSVLVLIGSACGGSKPVSQSGGFMPSPSPVTEESQATAIPDYPLPPEKPNEEKGIIKLYLKAYNHCEEEVCKKEIERETEEERLRFSIPYYGDKK